MASSSDHPLAVAAVLAVVAVVVGLDDTEGVVVATEGAVVAGKGCPRVGSRCCTRHSWSVNWVGVFHHSVL